MARINEELVLTDRFSTNLDKYIQKMDMADTATDKLLGSVRRLVGGFAGLKGVQMLVSLSDELTQTTARLDRMNDGLQTTNQLTRMIYQSAQRSRGSFQDTADMVAKLGTLAGSAFDSTAEIIAFAEQVNKQMVLSGTNTQSAQAAMLQLTQAMSSGVLRGDELNSILEQTPMIAQTIAQYMGVTTGEMRNMAAQGQVTAAVVKNAMLQAAAETNAQFEQMPMTWGQVWNSFRNTAIMALNPVLKAVSWLASNIRIIGPLVIGVGAAFAVFQIAAVATTIYTGVVNFLSIAFGVLTGNTAAASAAVFTFNSALLASPITWIIMGITLIIGLIYAGVAAYNKATGQSISATGLIVGAIYTLAAVANNVTTFMWNAFANFANFIGNVFHSPVSAVKILFYDMATTVLGFISNIAHGIEDLINKLPGVEVDLTSGIDNLVNDLAGKSAAEKENSGWTEYFQTKDYADLSEQFAKGYDKGSNLFNFGSDFDMDGLGGMAFDQLGADVGDIKDSTKAIQKSVDMSKEDVKSLLDVATRKYVNNINLTAQTPVINVTGANTGNTPEDRRALAAAIRDIIVEQAASGSVRTTARTF